jgi:hypothetical protein
VRCSGQFGEQEMIGASVIKLCLIHLTPFFFVASGWIPGLFDRERRKKMVVQGSKLIRKIASEAFDRTYGWCPRDKRISG